MGRPELWLVAGPNGAGKTTIVQQEPIQSLLPHVITLNPDDRSLKILRSAGFNSFASAPKAILKQTFIRAANEIFAEAASELAKGRAICLETVLSTEKYRPLLCGATVS